MWFRNLLQSVTSTPGTRPAYRRPSTLRRAVEPLDDRCLPSFSPTGAYAVAAPPTDVLTADFDQDGWTDLLATGVLLGNGDDTFRSVPSSPTDIWAASLVAEFNGDGTPDLAGSNGVMLGNGDGTFGPPSPLPPGAGFLFDLAAGDLNADGNIDLVAARAWYGSEDEPGTGSIDILPGNGEGSFAPPWTLPAVVGNWPGSLAVADLNREGELDVVASELLGWGHVSIFPGNGDGTLQPDIGFTIPVP
jgi:hypothetical protein